MADRTINDELNIESYLNLGNDQHRNKLSHIDSEWPSREERDCGDRSES